MSKNQRFRKLTITDLLMRNSHIYCNQSTKQGKSVSTVRNSVSSVTIVGGKLKSNPVFYLKFTLKKYTYNNAEEVSYVRFCI